MFAGGKWRMRRGGRAAGEKNERSMQVREEPASSAHVKRAAWFPRCAARFLRAAKPGGRRGAWQPAAAAGFAARPGAGRSPRGLTLNGRGRARQPCRDRGNRSGNQKIAAATSRPLTAAGRGPPAPLSRRACRSSPGTTRSGSRASRPSRTCGRAWSARSGSRPCPSCRYPR